ASVELFLLPYALLFTYTAPPAIYTLSLHDALPILRGVFDVPSPRPVQGRGVLIVDDVYTTGATASGVALALKRAGSRRVCGAFAAASSLERDFLDAGARGV